jgi:hypothetical protein
LHRGSAAGVESGAWRAWLLPRRGERRQAPSPHLTLFPHLCTPQVAEQQGKYLARCLNAAAGKLEAAEAPPFAYKHLGSMASVGECRGLAACWCICVQTSTALSTALHWPFSPELQQCRIACTACTAYRCRGHQCYYRAGGCSAPLHQHGGVQQLGGLAQVRCGLGWGGAAF